MKKFDIEEGTVPVKAGLVTLSRNAIILVAVGTAIIFTGSILATYYGKPTCSKSSELDTNICTDLFCKDSSLLNSNYLFYRFFFLFKYYNNYSIQLK